MKTVKGYVSTNKVGSECTFEFDVEDDATEEQIHEAATDAMFNCLDWSYEIVEE